MAATTYKISTGKFSAAGYFSVGLSETSPVTAVYTTKAPATGKNLGQITYDSTTDKYTWTAGIKTAAAAYSIAGTTTSVLNLTTGSGNDSVSVVAGDGSSFTLGDGANTVSILGGNSVKVTTGAGADSVFVVGNDATVSTGNGKDVISVAGTGAVIDAGAGDDSIVAVGANTKITAGVGNDTVSVGAGANVTIDGGAGNDSIEANGASDYITAGAGNDTVSIGTGATSATVDGGAGNDSIVAAADSAYINAGDGNDFVSVSGNDATVLGGAGNDSIQVAAGSATITFGAGNDTVSVGAANVTLTDYTFGTDKIVLDGSKIAGYATNAVTNFGTDGKLVFGDTHSVTVGMTGSYYAAEITTGTGTTAKTTAFAWATADGGTINASAYKKGAIIIGTNNDENGDLIIGSAGADTIYAGSNDTVYGGKGNDSIVVADDAENVMIGLYADGSKDSISGAGYVASTDSSYDDDSITTIYYNGDVTKAKLSLKGGKLTAKNGTSSLTFTDSSASSTGVGFKVTNGTTTYNVETVIEDGSATLYEGTNSVYGKNSGINVTDDIGDTVIDLGNTGKYGDTRYYSGITKASAKTSTSDVVLIGSASDKNMLVGGQGATTLYGGGSKADVLEGYADSVSAAGTTVYGGADTFVYGSSDGRDMVTNYHYDADDATASDTLYFTTTDFTKVTRTNITTSGTDTNTDAVKFSFGSGTNGTLTVETADSVDTAISYVYGGTTYKAKVGVTNSASTSNTFTYDRSVNFYIGGKGTDTLTVSDDANIWLNGYTGTGYSSIEVVDASSSLGDVTLAGGAGNETLIAGLGSSALYGGAGNDTLVGNATGTTTFYFGNGDGSDVITTSNADDRVMLYNVAASDLKSAEVNSSGAMVIALNDGSKLTVTGIGDGTAHTFTLSDGSTYTYTNGEWAQA